MKLSWLADPHFEFLDEPTFLAFVDELAKSNADAFLITGDIGNATNILFYLTTLHDALQKPIYFVLGNHDFYNGSIERVRKDVRSLCAELKNLHWLSDLDIVPLSGETALLGHDGWYDFGFGDYRKAPFRLNDFELIMDREIDLNLHFSL